MNYAPVVLFVYNRPWHTQQTLEALIQNEFSSESDLFIFSDAARNQSDEEAVKEVRNYIHKLKGFHEITIEERSINYGLAKSIISGVTEVLQKRDSVIVLEDDIFPSPGFLKYMNDSLKLYQNESEVGCIHAWNYNLNTSNYNDSTFFLKGADCWGWATWKRGWDLFNPDGNELLKIIKNNNLEYEFNRQNTHSFIKMLKEQIEGKNDSWAIRWHASLFVNDMLCLHPARPIVKNIGLDNSGVHSGVMNLKQEPVDFIEIRKIPVKESAWFFSSYSDFLGESISTKTYLWQKLSGFLKRLLHQS